MYADHVPVISNAMRNDAEAFKRGLLFVVLSIRQPIIAVRGHLAEVDERRADAPCLLGWKRQAYRQIELEGRQLWRDVRELDDPAAVMSRLLDVHGLGLVKSAFAAQLMGCDIACLDSRNLQREGRPLRAYRFEKRGLTAKRKATSIARYVADVGGKAAEYWDTWCDDAGITYGMSGDAISALHLDCLPPDFIPF